MPENLALKIPYVQHLVVHENIRRTYIHRVAFCSNFHAPVYPVFDSFYFCPIPIHKTFTCKHLFILIPKILHLIAVQFSIENDRDEES